MPNCLPRQDLIVLANDPGSTNSGYCLALYRLKEGVLERRILECGLLPVTLKELKLDDVATVMKGVLEHSLLPILNRHRLIPHIFVAERFMQRRGGSISGGTGEKVSMMIALLANHLHQFQTHSRLVTSAQWKNRLNKVLKQSGKSIDDFYRLTRTTPHELDACLIGEYIAAKHFNIDPFIGFNKKTVAFSFMTLVETKTTGQLRRVAKRYERK